MYNAYSVNANNSKSAPEWMKIAAVVASISKRSGGCLYRVAVGASRADEFEAAIKADKNMIEYSIL